MKKIFGYVKVNSGGGKYYKYIVLGLFIYAVLITGGTYAYYYSSSSNSNVINGDLALANANLTVERIVPDSGNARLVPLLDKNLDIALKGTGGVSSCIDGNSNLSCEVYKITINNTGSTNLRLKGTVTIAATGQNNVYNNLKWEEIESPTSRKSEYLTNGMGTSTLDDELRLNVGGSKTYYIAVWLSENNQDQTDTDKGEFGGLVSFEDSNGQGVTATFKEFDKDYCTNEGITKLSDCLLITEKYSNTVDEAKEYISTKEADFNNTAPISTYKEKIEKNLTNDNGVFTTTNQIYVGDSYTFDEQTGQYTIKNYSLKEMTEALSTSSDKYYTCGSTSTSGCGNIYVIYNATSTVSGATTTYRATNVDRYASETVVSNLSDNGLYKTVDDYGDTYYYRGKVDNNYVSFAGYVWRIVRINGDGSIRLIYSGTSTSDTGSKTSIGTSAFNSDPYDPASVGYKYGLDKVLQHTTNTFTYTNISATTKYYFGDSYTTNDNTKKLSISGNTVQGTLEEIWGSGSSNYKYTCFSTSQTGTCTTLVEIQSYNSSISVKAKYHSYLSKSYESTYTDENNSTIKTKIDDWYKTNIEDKGYSEYLSDNIFCNDRSINSGDGFTLNATTIYKPYTRVYSNKTPSLECPRQEDQFTVNTSNNLGNGELTYPVGLLTIDEVSYAGGKHGNYNRLYYLYTGQTYWTMSPSYFTPSHAHARVWNVSSAGNFGSDRSSDGYGVRPVINLKADTTITSGNGTASSPYVIKYD